MTGILRFVTFLVCCLPLAVSLSTPNKPANAAKAVWFRDHALRVRDNDALYTAVEESSSEGVIPIYLWKSTGSPVDPTTGGTASDVFVANALQDLNRTLCGRLLVGWIEEEEDTAASSYANELEAWCHRIGAVEIYYMESHDQTVETALRDDLISRGLCPRSFRDGHTLLDYSREEIPWKTIVLEHPFRSPLIPFVDYLLKRLEETPPPLPKPTPEGLEESIAGATSSSSNASMTNPTTTDDLIQLVGVVAKKRTDWGSGIVTAWPASERDALKALGDFLAADSKNDSDSSNPDAAKRTHLASRLSPYLARGLLSAREVYHALTTRNVKGHASFVRRICWRDYTYAVAALFPDVTRGVPIRDGYDNTAKGNLHMLQLWKQGQTGFPLVDAGMRQLTTEGWMPQKVRLAASTCLVEGLGGSYQQGMDHFASFLVDYDPAINANMWMNAGCVGFDPYYVGTDYKRRPYWDRKGDYVRNWCPELRNLPDHCELPEPQRGIGTFRVDCLYEPWSAPESVLETAGVVLGESYPHRCCDERTERKQFFESVRNRRAQWPASKKDEKGRDVVRLGRDPDSESIGMFTTRSLLDAFEPVDETEVSDDSIIEQLNIMNMNSGSQTSVTSDGSLSDVSDLTNLTNMDTVMERNKKRKPSHTELAHALKTFTIFFETNEDSEDDEAGRITGAIGILLNAMPAPTKQSYIESFFI